MKDVKCGSADLIGALLVEADLSGARFVRSDFSAANLTQANLENADLSEATLSHATLHRTRINGANLESVTGLTENQLKSALGDEQTKLPPERERPCALVGGSGQPLAEHLPGSLTRWAVRHRWGTAKASGKGLWSDPGCRRAVGLASGS